MSKVKKQHYVPQFYLKRFTYDGERLFVFDKFAQKQRTANIKDVAEEKYFYDLPISEIVNGDYPKNFDVQIIEKALSQIEGHYSKAVKNLLENLQPKTRLQSFFDLLKFRGNTAITKRQKGALAFFITIQYFRTKESRELTGEVSKKIAQAIMDATQETKFTENSSNVLPVIENTKDSAVTTHLQSLLDPKLVNTIAGALNNHIWVIGINETRQPFYTSDHPVIKKGHIENQFRSFEGIGSKGIEVALPLSPKYILLLYERTFFKAIEKMDRQTTLLAEENVTYYNSLQVLQSYRQIYCSEKNFDLAEDMCRENPNLNSPKKNRIQVN